MKGTGGDASGGGGKLSKIGERLQGLGSLMQLQFSNSSASLSHEFFNLVKGIGEAKSKLEEDLILEKEQKLLRSAIANPDNSKNMREYVVRLMYCEMLGHDVSWAYIHAINMTQQSKLLDKWVGYVAVATFLHRDHELLILLISSLRRDLGSTNQLHVCAALTAVSHLISEETIPAILPLVTELLQHEKAVVRKKAVMALLRFYHLSPTSVPNLSDKVRRSLCDADPSVMSASLNLVECLVEKQPRSWKDVVPTLVSILKQIVQRRLPKHYEYHHVQAPWTQIKILRLLGMLGAGDKRASEHMYDVLADVMKQPTTHNAAYALVYECVKTIASVYPNSALLEAAASSISQFITSKSNNLKYIGIDGLSMIMTIDAKHVQRHQMQVVDCLRSPDDTLKRKTLDLLYKMTNPVNVEMITQKMIDHLAATSDFHLRTELVSRITQLAERFSPNNEWFIETMIHVFQLGGELVRPEIAHNLMQLIAEGVEDEEGDAELRIYAVTKLMDVLEKDSAIADILIQLAVWVLSEYGYMSPTHTLNQIAERLVFLLEQTRQGSETLCWIITGLTKLVAQMKCCPPSVEDVVAKYKRSRHIDLQQRCYEFEALINFPEVIQDVFPIDASCEDIIVDDSLSFLDEYVQKQLAAGAKPYLSPEKRPDFSQSQLVDPKKVAPKLKFDKYAEPVKIKPLNPAEPAVPETGASVGNTDPLSPPKLAPASVSTGPRKWTKAGYQGDLSATSTNLAPVKSGGSTSGYQSPSALAADTAETHPKESGSDSALDRWDRRESERGSSTFGDKISKEDQGLFAGLTAGSGDAGAARGTARRKIKAAAETRSMDLFGEETKSPKPLSPPASGSGNSGTSSPSSQSQESSTPTPTMSQPSAYRAEDNLINTMDAELPSGSSSFPSPSIAQSTPASIPKSTSIDDILGGLDLSASSEATTGGQGTLNPSPAPTIVMSHKHNGNLDFSSFPFPPHLARDLGATPLKRSPAVNKTGSEDGTLHVSHYFIHKDDESVLALFVSNLNVKPQSNISAVVEVPDNVQARFASVEGVDVTSEKLCGSFRCVRLTGQSAVVLCAFLTFTKLGVGLNIKVNLTYTNDRNQPKRLQFTLPLHIAEFLRPFQLTTAEYGTKWGTYTHPNKIKKVAAGISSIQDLVSLMQTHLNLHHIQTIRTEAIACARLLGSGDPALVLVHAKVAAPTNVELSVRTTNMLFTEAVSRHIERVLN